MIGGACCEARRGEEGEEEGRKRERERERERGCEQRLRATKESESASDVFCRSCILIAPSPINLSLPLCATAEEEIIERTCPGGRRARQDEVEGMMKVAMDVEHQKKEKRTASIDSVLSLFLSFA